MMYDINGKVVRNVASIDSSNNNLSNSIVEYESWGNGIVALTAPDMVLHVIEVSETDKQGEKEKK